MKRLFSIILSFIMVFTAAVPSFAASTDKSQQIVPLQAVKFDKVGKVITIVNNYNNSFFLKTENLKPDGTYSSPATVQSIKKEDFEKYYKSKAFDKVEIRNIVTNKDTNTYMFVSFNKDGNLIDESWAGTVVSGSFEDVTVNTTESQYNWILNDRGKYYQVTSVPGQKKSTYNQITDIQYKKLIFDKNFTYSRVIKTEQKADGNIYSDISYDKNDKPIGIPTFVKVDPSINIAEVFYLINALNVAKKNNEDIVYSVDSINQYIKQYEDDGEKVDENKVKEQKPEDITSKFGIPTDLLDKYKDKYQFWSDNYNYGYLGNWLDPYFNGKSKVLDWVDPFWKQSEIIHGNASGGVQYGYYDDMGNYIKLDSNGNPIPKEAGTFDSDGNFRPKGTSGYYDPDGVYHPDFSKISGLKYDSEGNLYFGTTGYYDKNGLWHSKDKVNEIILYDGRIIYENGIMYNPKTKQTMKLKSDIWGKYYIGNDEIVYQDYSVYNKKTNKLTYADGTVYNGVTNKNYILFPDNTSIILPSYEKGTKKDSYTVLSNGTKVTDKGVIQYPNNITFDNNKLIIKDKTINAEFKGDYIDVSGTGRIYRNGHLATYNKYGELVTDEDAVIKNINVTILANGNIYDQDGNIYCVYMDGSGNWISTNGIVYNRQLKLGAYNSLGVFVEGSVPASDYYYDHNGNTVYPDGKVVKNSVNGYYNENGVFDSSYKRKSSGYYTAEGNFVNNNGNIEENNKKYGYYDKSNNFVMNDKSGFFDSNGIFVPAEDIIRYTVQNGIFSSVEKGPFVLTVDGNIKLPGLDGTYDDNGIVTLNGKQGYYDSNGRFIIASENPYTKSGYFYDAKGNKYKLGIIYKDSENNLRLLKNPNTGISIKDGKIKLSHGNNLYDVNGITTVNKKKGYYNASGEFIESSVSPYLGGFYDDTGTWIDKTYYENYFGEICVNNGGFNYMGNYITPSGDIGSFNEAGNFQLNVSNTNKDFFYDENGDKVIIDNIYRDQMGFYKGISGSVVYDGFGSQVDSVDSIGLKIGDYTMLGAGMFLNDKTKEIGYFDKNQNFIKGKSPYVEGFYTQDGGFITYTKDNKANYKFLNRRYYVVMQNDNEGYLSASDGYSFPIHKVLDGDYVLSNGIGISQKGEIGYVNVSGDFKIGLPSNKSDVSQNAWNLSENALENTENANSSQISSSSSSSSNSVLKVNSSISFVTDKGYHIDSSDTEGYYLSNGTYTKYTGEYGYYDKDKKFHQNNANPYLNGFYTKDGKWVSSGESLTPNTGYFNKYGIPRNGDNTYKEGYYDYEGSYHPLGKKYFIMDSGNVIKYGDKYIGYIDSDNKFFPSASDDKGYYDSDGTYYVGDEMKGYFDKNGALNKGKNQNLDGFYDKNKNWHEFGDKGYYDSNGNYIQSVEDIKNCYFNEAGEMVEGYNPYINGYIDPDGNWNNENTKPLTAYYESDGSMRIGLNKYKSGYYDKYMNWHPNNNEGYFDKNGTYYSISMSMTGYYDEKGNFIEGTNPYQHGYYNEYGELRIFDHPGKFDKEGTFIDDDGSEWHFSKDKIKNKGKNTDKNGFYDMNGNYYYFNEKKYVTTTGYKFPTILQVSKYKVGSPDYILFEGVFKNSESVPFQTKNTIQFTFNSDSEAPLYVDTGIRVAQNAMISYENARDLIHNISVYTKSGFFEDNNSCMVVVDGKIINLTNNGKVSIKSLSDKFIDSNVSIVVAKTRLGEKYVLADSIENNKDISIYSDNVKQAVQYPMIVKNNIPYVALDDFKGIIAYTSSISTDDNSKTITFSLKDAKKKDLPVKIVTTVGNTNCVLIEKDGSHKYYNLKAPIIEHENSKSKINQLYVPVYMLSNLSGKNVEFNTKKYALMFTDSKDILPFEDN